MPTSEADECGEPSAAERQRSLTWVQRLKRVLAIELEVCRRFGGKIKVVAGIEEPAARRLRKSLQHALRLSRIVRKRIDNKH